MKWDTSSDYLASICSFISIAVVVFLVHWAPMFLWMKYDELMEKKFENKYGALYEGIKPNNIYSVRYIVYFILIRFLLSLIVIFLDQFPNAQVNGFMIILLF